MHIYDRLALRAGLFYHKTYTEIGRKIGKGSLRVFRRFGTQARLRH